MKRFIALLVTLLMLMTLPSYAADVTTIIQDSPNVSFGGELEADGKSKNIVFWVLNKDIEWTDHTSLNPSDVKFFNTVELNGNETDYSFDFQLTENGKYRVVKNHGTANAEPVQYIGYTKKADFDSAIDTLAACSDASEVETYISNSVNKVKLAMYDDIFTLVTPQEAAAIVKATIDSDSSFRDLIGAYLAKAYQLNKTISLNDYVKNIKDGKLEKHYNPDNESSYETAILGVAYTSSDNFFDKLEETMILTNVKESSGASDITAMLNDYAAKLGLTKTVTDEISRSLMGNTYTKTTLATAVNTYTSGGTGGGSSVNNGSTPTISQGNGISVGTGKPAGGSASGTGIGPGNVLFTDITSVPWAKDAIETLFAKGVVNGKQANLFYPLDNVLREECVAMLMRAFQFNITGEEPEFTDVISGSWYEDVIKTAYNAGVVKGQGNGLFGIGQNVTRQDMAVMIYNALDVADIELPVVSEKTGYADDSYIASYAKEAVSYLQQRGVIKGYEDGTFGAEKTATRAELATMIYRILPYLELGK